MKKIIPLLMTLLLASWSFNAWSFACKTAAGVTIPIGGGSANVYVNLAPAVSVGQNLVVDLSTQIFCHNDFPETMTDYVTLQRGSAYGGVLSSFSGTVRYNGTSYPFPTTSETARMTYNSIVDRPWPTVLYLTPVSSAGGVAISAGSLIAVLILRQTNNKDNDDFQFVWNIYANNDVVVPTGGCDVSARDVTVTLPEYPASAAIPLTVYCAQKPEPGLLPLRYYGERGQFDIYQYRIGLSGPGGWRSADAQRQRRSREYHGVVRQRGNLGGQPWLNRQLCAHQRTGDRG
ncbi:mannose-specific adhesin FimH [Klebsiella oxytoca]|nr:mannose-specific adhesin FimH [Klebsiella oxytoca]